MTENPGPGRQLRTLVRSDGVLELSLETVPTPELAAHESTCNNWTVGTNDAQAMLGHADRMGRNPGVNSWNAIHPSQGCSMEALEATGGAGMFYCFATD